MPATVVLDFRHLPALASAKPPPEPRPMKLRALAIALLLSTCAQAAEPLSPPRRLEFAPLADGRQVLAVDLHTHSVFSDGEVWPSIRVQEAQRDGLFGYAPTEHLEYQPHLADIPHKDRNRSFEIATQEVNDPYHSPRVAGEPLVVINGAEITRDMPPGHCNAVFIADANKLLKKDPMDIFREAKRQGAFTFWNHPYWTDQTPDGVARLTPMHEKLIADGLLQGIEVANMEDVSPEAFRIAEQKNLTILGTSDVHGLLDWEGGLNAGGHRTATLVLARERSTPAVREALFKGDTVAVYKDTYVGLARNVEPLLRSVLYVETAPYEPETTLLPVTLRNTGALHITLQEIGPEGFYDGPAVIRVPAHGSVVLRVRDVADPAKLRLRFRVLSSMVGPDAMLEMAFGPGLAASK